MPVYRLVTLGGLVLLDEDGRAVSSLGPRNLALLAYLALANKPLSRDHVAEIFWGDRDEDRARHSMREALSRLRQLLGPEGIPQRSNSVALSASVPLLVDVRAFIAASASGDTRQVTELYSGPFLDGVHVGGSRSFEDWSDAERAMCEAKFVVACVPECARLRDAGEWTECAELARRWLRAAPLDAKPAIELLHALAASGTRDAQRLAMREYGRIAERLAADYEMLPHPSVVRTADEIARMIFAAPADERTNTEPSFLPDPESFTPRDSEPRRILASAGSPEPTVESHTAILGASPDTVAPARPRMGLQRRIRLVAVSVVAAGFIALVALFVHASSNHSTVPGGDALAIVPFDVGQPANGWLAAGVPRLLGSAIAREHIVNVLDEARLRDALPVSDTSRAPSSTDALAAARRLGARWLLTGSVVVGGGRYWLDMSLLDARNGTLTRRVTGADTTLDAVIAQATARVIASIDAHDGGAQFVELEPNTVASYRLYIRALQLRAQLRSSEAAAALDEAIATDSGFVDAVIERRYMLAAPTTTAAIDSARALDAAYSRGRSRAPEFERLYFDAYLALHSGDHARAEALGRTLLARYPHDPRAYLRAIDIFSMHGRFAEASRVAVRAIALDSAGRTAGSDECRVCVGYRAVSEMARITGDFPRAESAARRAIAFRPEDPAAWAQLSAVVAAQGRYDDALSAARHAGALAPTDPDFAMDAIRRLMEDRRYTDADSALRVRQSTNDPRFAADAAEMRALLLREHGQFRAAARVLDNALAQFPDDSTWLLLVQGENRANVGDAGGAKRAFAAAVPPAPRTHRDSPKSIYPADWARTFTWPRTLMADALWQAGDRDTVGLSILADSIQAIGARSYYARDWRLYHHVRGLIAMAGKRWSEAESEFSQARWGRSGWARTLVELAHAQLAQGHTAAAISTLRDAYSVQLSAMGLYVPRSELDFEMARAFTAASMLDSARVYTAHVDTAWRNSDGRVRRRLVELRNGMNTAGMSTHSD
jgi:DNA-binding SARP family transcriptional activator/TolB-like protein